MYYIGLFFLIILLLFINYTNWPTYFIESSNCTSSVEPFTKYSLENAGKYPESDESVILVDSKFKWTGNKLVGSDTYSDLWWNSPVLQKSSYKQITNNLKYQLNPDNGTCIDATFCNVLYENAKHVYNLSTILKPAKPETNEFARVNYYLTPRI
jgi:hypothetical protein